MEEPNDQNDTSLFAIIAEGSIPYRIYGVFTADALEAGIEAFVKANYPITLRQMHRFPHDAKVFRELVEANDYRGAFAAMSSSTRVYSIMPIASAPSCEMLETMLDTEKAILDMRIAQLQRQRYF